MSNQTKFFYTGTFRFDRSFVADLKGIMRYLELESEQVGLPLEEISDWDKIDIETTFAFYNYLTLNRHINYDNVAIANYIFYLLDDLAFNIKGYKTILYKQFGHFLILCFVPENLYLARRFVYIDNKKNVAIPMQIEWAPTMYRFCIDGFLAIKTDENTNDYVRYWKTRYTHCYIDFVFKINQKNKLQIVNANPHLPDIFTFIYGTGFGVTYSCEWEQKKQEIPHAG